MENRMFRLLSFVAAVVVLCALIALPVAADSKPTIIVSSFSIKEGGAYVGKDFTLSVHLMNTEPARCANTLTTRVSAGFPFINNGVNTFYSGDLCYPDSTVVDIPMRVDPTANGGFYQIDLNSNYETSTGVQFTSSNTINLFVNGTPELNAHVINSDPIDIYAGDTGILTVSIENNGNFQAESLTAVLTAPAPLAVKWSKSLNSISLLASRSSKAVDFAVEVPKNAEARTYPIMLTVTYLDENKEVQTATFTLPFGVKPRAGFEAAHGGSDSFYANQAGKTVRLVVKNTGTDAALKARVKLVPAFPFSTDGSVRYVDQIKAGSSAPVDFSVNIDKNAKPGSYVLDLVVDYEDAQGKKLQDTTQAALVVKPKNFVRAVFLDYIVLWLIAGAVVLLIARKRSRKTHTGK